jgi:phage shock protein PspC (stress-responsive transcriptional regulator)
LVATFPTEQPLKVLSRSRSDRWLGGVCAGLARERAIHPAWVRAAFVLGALIGGVGILVYLACWMIVPQEGGQPGDASPGWLVGLAGTCAVCLGIAALAVLAAGVTLFGYGWVAVALTAGVLVGVLVAWPRLGPGWALLPIAAIALPAAGVASAGVQLTTDTGHVAVAPRVLAAGGLATFRAGLGTLLVDLRRTSLPATGTLDVRVRGGVRRTIIALPHDRCVDVELTYDVQPFWGQVASLFVGHGPAPGVVVFGAYQPGRHGDTRLTSTVPAPVLHIDFTSAGGSLYLRDYPDAVDPEANPNWRGFPPFPESRPDVRGLSRNLADFELSSWQARHAAEVRSQRAIQLLMGGPCVSAGEAFGWARG